MTGPTSEGSVNKEFVNEKYVGTGEIAGGGFNADTELTMEEAGNPNLKSGMEIPISDSKVKLSEEDNKKINEYVVRVFSEQIKDMEKMLKVEKDEQTKTLMKRKIDVMKIQLNMAKNADKDEISK